MEKKKSLEAYREYVKWMTTQKYYNKSQPDVVSRLQLYARRYDTTVRDMLKVKREIQPINEGYKRHVRWGPRT